MGCQDALGSALLHQLVDVKAFLAMLPVEHRHVAPRLSVKADLRWPRAAMCMLEASLPFDQPHHCTSPSDVSLIMQRPRAKLGDGELFHVKTQRLVVDHASQLVDSTRNRHKGRGTVASMQRSRGAPP